MVPFFQIVAADQHRQDAGKGGDGLEQQRKSVTAVQVKEPGFTQREPEQGGKGQHQCDQCQRADDPDVLPGEEGTEQHHRGTHHENDLGDEQVAVRCNPA